MIAQHLIFGAYGFWLPNDPRGSWSDAVWAGPLREFGPPAKVSTRESLAHREHDHALRLQAKQALRYPTVRLNGLQARAVGRGFAQIIRELDVEVYACVVMPDHVHLVTAKHCLAGKELIGFLKRAAARQLTAESMHPLAGYARPNGRQPSPWAAGGWCVFLDRPAQVWHRIRYVEGNPDAAGLPRQRWGFVVPFEDRPGGRG
jgi:REP element-mobilizing transposase RayT